MLRYFDSSALVKALIAEERGQQHAASLLGEARTARLGFATARIAALEALSKVWRSTGNRAEVAKLERHFAKFDLYEIEDDYDLARKIILDTGMKGSDAAILAIAVGLARRERVVIEFVSADEEQIEAARGFVRRERLRPIALPRGLK